MLSSLKSSKKLPRSLTPIFSLSMLDLNVCCTNIEKKLRVIPFWLHLLQVKLESNAVKIQEEIYTKVAMMNGKTSKIFTESVTHLVTTEVGSAKYHVNQWNFKKLIPIHNSIRFIVTLTGSRRYEHTSHASRLDNKCVERFRGRVSKCLDFDCFDKQK